jgi:hypothetical protein
MTIEQTLQDEIEESKRWIDTAEGVYKRDLIKRIELVNWVLETMKNTENNICELMESKMNNMILEINQTHDVFEADKLHSELGIMDWLFYQVCKDQQKKLAAVTNQEILETSN